MTEQADRLYELGLEEFRKGQYQDALSNFQEALAIYRQIGDRPGETKSLRNIGDTYAKLKDYLKFLDSYQQALDIYREANDLFGAAQSLDKIGIGYGKLVGAIRSV